MERFGAEIFKECPESLITIETRWLIQLVQAAHEYHSFPFPGSYVEQPVFFIEACSIVSREKERLFRVEEKIRSAKENKQ
ncbi:MAG: hypothetical protein D6816_04690 [Bacteroidetes bacterium]|nr:MAG: hypothetical protein D6816_04690 [Bacteroidota bacterium]